MPLEMPDSRKDIPGDGGHGAGSEPGTDHLNLANGTDLNILKRAVRERWPISGEARQKIIQELCLIATGQHPTRNDARSMVRAAQVLARMDALNQQDEHADRHYERIDEGKPTDLVKMDGVEIIVPGLGGRFAGDSAN